MECVGTASAAMKHPKVKCTFVQWVRNNYLVLCCVYRTKPTSVAGFGVRSLGGSGYLIYLFLASATSSVGIVRRCTNRMRC